MGQFATGIGNEPRVQQPRFPSCGAMGVFWVAMLSSLCCVFTASFAIVDSTGSVGATALTGGFVILLCVGIMYYLMRRRLISINYPSTGNVLGLFVVVAVVAGIGLPIAANIVRCGRVGAGNDLHNCNYDDKDFSGKDLHGTNFSGAKLNNADLSDTNLQDANLSGAELSGANLTGADLSDANATDADMSATTMTDVVLEGATLLGTDLHDAEGLTVAMIEGAEDRRGLLLEDWDDIVRDVGMVCSGSPLPNAPTYQSGDLKPLVIVNSTGDRHALTNDTPREWRPPRASQVGVIVCASEETSQQIQRCAYTNRLYRK